MLLAMGSKRTNGIDHPISDCRNRASVDVIDVELTRLWL